MWMKRNALDPILDVGILRKMLEGYPDDAQVLFSTPHEEINVPLDCIKLSIDSDGAEVTIAIDTSHIRLSDYGIDE